MKLTLRFVLPLLVVLSLIAYLVVPLVDGLTTHWFTRDLEIRSKLIGNSIEDSIRGLIASGNSVKVNSFLNKITLDDRLRTIGFCNAQGLLQYQSHYFPGEITCAYLQNQNLEQKPRVLKLPLGNLHIAAKRLDANGYLLGHLIFVHDMSFIQTRSKATRQYIFLFFLFLGLIVSILTVFIAQLSWRGWVSAIRTLFKGEGILKPIREIESPEVKPVIKEMWHLIRQLRTQSRVRDQNLVSWNPQMLKDVLNRELAGEEIITVSNREPYIHDREKDSDKINVRYPASGLVTALEPVMRACSGIWIAHGSGSADKEVVDRKNKIQVPPDKPRYTLRRIWLTPQEEQGYYYGFSNEGLWPLCHIAHTRPIFRSSDWEEYIRVNQKFAQAVIDEAKTEDPIILVQDYHFALLPQMVRKKLPKATIITFWHIPWPNPEDFSICPWREEILEGLLGSSILGFHTQFHCNNFIDTVDQFLECRIDREHLNISYNKKITAVNTYPISIEWPPRWLMGQKTIPECQLEIRLQNHLPITTRVGLGVDRLDYTKGIVERFLAVERLLILHPEWIGKFVFIQIAAPSRSSIDSYHKLDDTVRMEADRINAKFQKEQYRPILLKIEHHDPFKIYEHYRASDLCFVSSLHDGMNLVAKEFVSARDDEQGVLVLSYFAGASRELPEALIVNPYDSDQCAEALHIALKMPQSEQKDRMRNMRGYIQENNVFRWAGRMLMDAAQIRRRNRLLKNTRRHDFFNLSQNPQ